MVSKFAIVILSIVVPISAQQTLEEIISTELSGTLGQPVQWVAPVYDKAPVDATLQKQEFEGGATVAPPHYSSGALITVDADKPIVVDLVNWQAPSPQPTPVPSVLPASSPCPSGVCVSFGSQGAAALTANTGKRIKGFQMIDALIYANHDANVSVGLILMAARSQGIQTVDNQTGLAIVNNTVSLNWRSVGKVVLVAGLTGATALGVGGIIHMSVALTRAVTFGHLAVDQILPPLFALGAPKPDPYVNAAKDPNTLIPMTAGSSQHIMFGAIYSGAKSSITTGPIQVMQ